MRGAHCSCEGAGAWACTGPLLQAALARLPARSERWLLSPALSSEPAELVTVTLTCYLNGLCSWVIVSTYPR